MTQQMQATIDDFVGDPKVSFHGLKEKEYMQSCKFAGRELLYVPMAFGAAGLYAGVIVAADYLSKLF